uniref:Organic cation transporter protein-like n=1 Tax=Saccoglossus kowalevskii TaxID=10224 RepID=A0ABM0LUS2_SACKO|nr:PREDICTED: organic cation transporter protein-like [Saccoglossus kowalevskii]
MANTFLSASSDHYCRVHDNQTYQENSRLKNCTIPYEVDEGEVEWSKCDRYNVTDQDCYDDETEFDLVCEKDWMKQLSKAIYPLGSLFGTAVIGQLSDKLVPESVRWLMQQGRYQDAEKILQNAAKMNKVTLPENVLEEEKQAQETRREEQEKGQKIKKYTVLDLMKTKNLRRNTIIIAINIFCNLMVYLGLSANTNVYSSNAYASFFVSGAVEVPAYLLSWFLLDRIGRRWLTCIFMLAAGLALILIVPVSNQSLNELVTILALFGKFCISGSFGVIYIFAAEIFPTPARAAGLGFTGSFGTLGGIAAPFVMLLANYVWGPLPFLIFGVSSVIAGLLVLLLPETTGVPLPETLEEGEMFGKKSYPPSRDIGLQVDLPELDLACRI